MNLKKIFLASAAFLSCEAYSQESSVEGVVNRIEAHATYSSVRNLRVKIEGVTNYCETQNGSDIAYLQADDAPKNFNVFISLLLSSQMSGTKVKLYTHSATYGCAIHRVDLVK